MEPPIKREASGLVPVTRPTGSSPSSSRPDSLTPTGPNEPNLRVVRDLDTGNDDPEMHFTVAATVPEVLDRLRST